MGDDGADLMNVLVIDDDEDMRQLLVDILIPLEHQVFAVSSAEEGLELLPLHTFHLAFLDQNLPGMEGLVLGEFLRRNNPHLHVTLVTGSDDPRLERIARKHGISVIRKPFAVQQIRDVLDTHRDEVRSRREREAERASPEFHASLGAHRDRITERFAPLNVSERVTERITSVVRDALTAMRERREFDEEDRTVALAGLIALDVLGLTAPRSSSGRTLFEEYDALMEKHQRRTEFSTSAGDG